MEPVQRAEPRPGPRPLTAAGLDVSRARVAFAGLIRAPATEPGSRQAHADDICAWLRLIWGPGRATGPGNANLEALAVEVAAYLVARLADPGAADTFCGLDLDLSRTVLRGVTFHRARFSGGTVDFRGCVFDQRSSFGEAAFSGGRVLFDGATFLAERHSPGFHRAIFSGAEVSFESAEFRNGWADFSGTAFTSGEIRFNGIQLTDTIMLFTAARFDGATVRFDNADLRSGRVSLHGSRCTAGLLSFSGVKTGMGLSFDKTHIDGCHVSLDGADLGHVSFTDARLTAGAITMRVSVAQGGSVSFDGMTMDGGELILDGARILFGEFMLDKITFVSGTLSLEDVAVEIEGVLELPWARYTAYGTVLKDGEFDGSRPHDFYTKTASYTPQARIRWGRFQPGTGGASPR